MLIWIAKRRECGSRVSLMRWCVAVALVLCIGGMVLLGAKQQKLEQRLRGRIRDFGRNIVDRFNGYGQENVVACVGWRETNFCHPYG
jgi:hypothetical protein